MAAFGVLARVGYLMSENGDTLISKWIDDLENSGLLFGTRCGYTSMLRKAYIDGEIKTFDDVLKFNEQHDDHLNAYKLYWLDGKTEIVRGLSASDAFNKAGIGRGALPALDYYETLREVV